MLVAPQPPRNVGVQSTVDPNLNVGDTGNTTLGIPQVTAPPEIYFRTRPKSVPKVRSRFSRWVNIAVLISRFSARGEIVLPFVPPAEIQKQSGPQEGTAACNLPYDQRFTKDSYQHKKRRHTVVHKVAPSHTYVSRADRVDAG